MTTLSSKMYLLNHCSAQTEIYDINPPESEAISNLKFKILLQSFLLTAIILFTICFAPPVVFSQETADSDLGQIFEEDPLSESDQDLGLDEDPLSESDQDLGLDEDPLSESDHDLG